ncbi:MAG TPA: SRPBCC family protein [Trebonia sp.]
MTTAVAAPAGAVYQLFTDVERWPQLTASITEVRRADSGPIRVGSEAVVRQPRLPRARWRVTELVQDRTFTWETTAAGVTTSGAHAVEPDGQHSVITLTLRQHGPFAWLASALSGGLARKYLTMEMEGFRRAAEAGRHGSVPGTAG